MSQRYITRNRFNFKFGLAFRELGAIAVLIAGILCFHYSGLSLFYPYEWLANIGVGFLVFVSIYLLGCYGNPLSFKKWYNEENIVVEYDPIEVCKDGEIVYPKRDAFWEYLSILGIIVVPSSFLISFFIIKYGVHIVNIPWYYWIGVAIYCGLVVFPVLSNLKHKTYRPQPVIRTGYKETERVIRLRKALKAFNKLDKRLRREENALFNLEIPVPYAPTETNPAPYIEYVGKIADMGKTHPEVASLEQLLLSVTSFSSIDGWEDSLFKTFKALGGIESVVQHSLRDTITSMGKYAIHPDKETSHTLLSNILEHLHESGESQYFKFKLLKSSNKIVAIGKEFAKDGTKGFFDTFSPEDFKDNLHASYEDFQESVADFFHHFEPEFNMPGEELFEPDFDFTGHFPIISTTKELFKNIGRYQDGDIDMGKSVAHSLTKIAGTSGGAALGALIGSVVFPGVGSIIGGMIGSWLGRSGASKLNAMEFERLKEEFESEKIKLDDIILQAQESIKEKQIAVNMSITEKAEESNIKYKSNIEASPLEAFNVSVIHWAIVIMISDYIWDCAEQYSPKSSKYDKLKYESLIDLRATKMEILTNPSQAAFRMLSGLEGMLDRDIEEPGYLKLDFICDTLYDSILNYALSMQTLHLVWMEHTRLLYTTCVREVTETVESEFDSLNRVVKDQEDRVKSQSDKCKELASAAEREAKTQ